MEEYIALEPYVEDVAFMLGGAEIVDGPGQSYVDAVEGSRLYRGRNAKGTAHVDLDESTLFRWYGYEIWNDLSQRRWPGVGYVKHSDFEDYLLMRDWSARERDLLLRDGDIGARDPHEVVAILQSWLTYSYIEAILESPIEWHDFLYQRDTSASTEEGTHDIQSSSSVRKTTDQIKS